MTSVVTARQPQPTKTDSAGLQSPPKPVRASTGTSASTVAGRGVGRHPDDGHRREHERRPQRIGPPCPIVRAHLTVVRFRNTVRPDSVVGRDDATDAPTGGPIGRRSSGARRHGDSGTRCRQPAGLSTGVAYCGMYGDRTRRGRRRRVPVEPWPRDGATGVGARLCEKAVSGVWRPPRRGRNGVFGLWLAAQGRLTGGPAATVPTTRRDPGEGGRTEHVPAGVEFGRDERLRRPGRVRATLRRRVGLWVTVACTIQ